MDDRLATMAAEFAELYRLKEELETKLKDVNKQFDRMRMEIIPDAMEQEEITSCVIEGIGRLGLTSDAWVSMPNKFVSMDWMRDNGFEDLIQETVWPGTLKAWAKEQYKLGAPPPEDIVKFQPYTRASITKIKK